MIFVGGIHRLIGMDIIDMADSITISITIEELWLHKWGMYETIEILHPGHLSFILAYDSGQGLAVAHSNIGSISFVLK